MVRRTQRSDSTRRRSRGGSEVEGTDRRSVWGIKREMLMGILEIAKEKYPNEFLATLTQRRGVIHEINIIPGTIEGGSFSVLQPFMQPPDVKFNVVGSVHSHPSPSARPSQADIIFFGKNGHTHIIVAYPFTMHSWRAYDGYGKQIYLKIVD
jgi:proteasome lid subunit RPN8/RPN11